jgi:hypothetical protein
MYRLLPVEEIMQFEASNAIITRSVHEEFARSQYIGHAAHKWIGIVNEDNEYCEPFDDEAWEMREFTGEGESGFDTRYIYVKMAAADLQNIAALSLDLLDDILIDLGDEDEAYRVDLRDIGILKMDMIVPDARVARKLFVQAKDSNGFWNTEAEYDKSLSDLRLGIPRTIGDYTFSYDNNAYRYNADTAYNDPTTGGPDGSGLATFDENDDTTWPRLVRVPRYLLQESGELGYEYVPNREYRRADFAITVQWLNNAMLKWRNPSWTGTGEVQMLSQDYSGDFTWRRPDWECNRKQKQGFFDAEFRVAMQVKDPKLMHVVLHRLDHSRQLMAAPCPVQEYTPPVEIEDFVCQAVE